VPLTTEVPRNTRLRASAIGWGGRGQIDRLFLNGHRLSGKRRLLDMQITGFHQSCVRGDAVASGETDDVAGDEITPRDLHPGAISQDAPSCSTRARHS
jgi:hypothetical protein